MKKYIDVRESYEFSAGHLDGAINIPLSDFEANFDLASQDLNKDDEIIVYCRSGGRASMAQDWLLKNGFKNVLNGINAETIRATF